MTWPMVKFHELISSAGLFTDGDWVESKDQDPNGNVRLIQLADIGLGCFTNKSDRYLTKEKALELNCTFLNPGDILIARMPDPIGRACIFPQLNQECVTVVDICVVRPKNENVDSKWLMHCINSREFNNQILNYVTGTTRQRISRGNLSNLNIAIPPLAEQKRIAAILDKADAIRQKRQQAIALADDFLRSVFLDMFGDPVTNPKGWEIQPISKVAEVQGGLQVTKKREGLPVTCPYLRVANVYRGRLELSEIKTMQVTEIEQERVALVKNDILIVEGHGNKEEIGRCAMWDGSIENMVHQNHLIRVRVINNRVLPQYLTDFINSEGGRGQLIGASNTTSGLNTISTRLVKETAVLIPDLHIQERYIQIFKKVTETLNHFQQGTLEGKGFFESLSQKAFSGQL